MCWPDKLLSSLSLSRYFCSLSSPYRVHEPGGGQLNRRWIFRGLANKLVPVHIHTVKVSYFCPKQEVRLIQKERNTEWWVCDTVLTDFFSSFLFSTIIYFFLPIPFPGYFLPGTQAYTGWRKVDEQDVDDDITLRGGALFMRSEIKPAIGRAGGRTATE